MQKVLQLNPSKQFIIQTSGMAIMNSDIIMASGAVLTVPQTGTVALLNRAQTFTQTQTIMPSGYNTATFKNASTSTSTGSRITLDNNDLAENVGIDLLYQGTPKVTLAWYDIGGAGGFGVYNPNTGHSPFVINGLNDAIGIGRFPALTSNGDMDIGGAILVRNGLTTPVGRFEGDLAPYEIVPGSIGIEIGVSLGAGVAFIQTATRSPGFTYGTLPLYIIGGDDVLFAAQGYGNLRMKLSTTATFGTQAYGQTAKAAAGYNNAFAIRSNDPDAYGMFLGFAQITDPTSTNRASVLDSGDLQTGDKYPIILQYWGGTVGIGKKPLDNANGAFDAAGSINTDGVYRVANTQVVGAKKTGWGSPSGTLYRTALSNSSTQAQFNQSLMALIIDLRSHGLIG